MAFLPNILDPLAEAFSDTMQMHLSERVQTGSSACDLRWKPPFCFQERRWSV